MPYYPTGDQAIGGAHGEEYEPQNQSKYLRPTAAVRRPNLAKSKYLTSQTTRQCPLLLAILMPTPLKKSMITTTNSKEPLHRADKAPSGDLSATRLILLVMAKQGHHTPKEVKCPSRRLG